MSKNKNKRNFDKYKEKLISQLIDDDLNNKQPKTLLYSDGIKITEDVVDREIDHTIKEIIDERQEQIREALKRINEGSYGICSECSQPIDLERLEIMPEATLCIKCQKQKEKRLQTIIDIRDNFFPDQLS